MYEKSIPPDTYDPSWIQTELDRVAQAITFHNLLFLIELHQEPEKPRSGMVALADGTDWNPGSGAGVYAYYGSAWNKLG